MTKRRRRPDNANRDDVQTNVRLPRELVQDLANFMEEESERNGGLRVILSSVYARALKLGLKKMRLLAKKKPEDTD